MRVSGDEVTGHRVGSVLSALIIHDSQDISRKSAAKQRAKCQKTVNTVAYDCQVGFCF